MQLGKSIAVLPFVNLSPDPENEYFSDGISEEIINALTKIEGLKVIARTSSFAFKGKNIDVRTIAQQLGVTSLLEGSVRKAQNRVRITAQLINAVDGDHIWSKNFDRKFADIFALQDEISLLIADQIRENFGHIEIKERLVQVPTRDVEAYNLYLKARYYHLKWDGDGIQNAIKLYGEAIQKDPGFSLPYFGAGYCYAMSASWGQMPDLLIMAEQYINKGFQLDNASYLGYFAKATLYFWGYWNFKQGAENFEKAIRINPAYTEAEEGLVELYTAIGYFDLAKEHAQNLIQINPLSHNHYYTLANIHYLQRDYSGAKKYLLKSLSIDPNFTHAIGLLQICYILLKEQVLLEKLLEQNPLSEEPELCHLLYQLMHEQGAIKLDYSAEGPLLSLFPWKLFIAAQNNELDQAIRLLEHAIQKKQGQYINFANIPLLAPLAEQEAYQTLRKELLSPENLPSKSSKNQVSPVEPERQLLSKKEAIMFQEKIESLMLVEEKYLDTDLSLRTLALELGLHPNKLSWLINENIGKNFNEYINSFRLEAFKKKALDPVNSHLTVLGLAYESGFNSKSVFNAYFKKMEGITPSAWMRSLK